MQVIGLDIGYGDVKILSEDVSRMFPTIVAPARTGSFDMEAITPIEVGGKMFHIGDDAQKVEHKLDLRYKSWIREDVYLALFKKALSLTPPGEKLLITGLPVSEYNEWKEQVKKRLQGRYVINGSDYWIAEVRVMPQPFGTFFNYILDNYGKVTRSEVMTGNIGIIDIGYRTTDFILVVSGKYQEGKVSGTIDAGVSNVIEGIRKQVAEKYNVDLSIERAREALKTKSVKVFGEVKVIQDIIENENSYWSTYIVHQAKTRWDSGGHVDEILLSGGGSFLFKNHLLDIFPHLRVPSNPSLSNATGFYKYGKKTLASY